MPLRITKATDAIEVKTITTCIIGDPGLGKTSLAESAEKPLLLDFDRGAHRAKNRGDVVEIAAWGDVTNILPADLSAYQTLVVDTAGRALDCLAADIMERDPKAGRGGSLTLQGYGALKGQFTSWLRLMRSFGLDVVLIAHVDEQKKGDETIVRLDAQGSSKNEIYKSADMMGRLYLDKGKRILNFSPTDVAFGKNPGQFPPIEVPTADGVAAPSAGFLAKIIADTKASLNKLSAEATTAQAQLLSWAERIAKADSLTDFDALAAAGKAEGAPKAVGAMIARAAKVKGWSWNKTTGLFDLAEKAKAA